MTRERLGVALLLPSALAREIIGLRRALGSAHIATQPPHITLVPPVNVPTDEVDRAITIVRSAVTAGIGPMVFKIGPVATFAPVSPVIYLCVGGDVEPLRELRERCLRPPLQRRIDHEYVPHVTLHEQADEHLNTAAQRALAAYSQMFVATHVDVLREDSDHVWRSIAEIPLSSVVRGRGTVELRITSTGVISPDVCTLMAACLPAIGDALWNTKADRVLEARDRDGALLGALTYFASAPRSVPISIEAMAIAPSHQGMGIAGRLIDELIHHATSENAPIIADIPEDWSSLETAFERRGFSFSAHTASGRRFSLWSTVNEDSYAER